MIKSKVKSISQQMRLPPLPSIKELIKLYKLRALRQLSQNFLLDLRLTNKIVRAAGNIRGGEVMEVGPGPGGITRSILQRNPSKVILVEKDARFLPTLQMLVEAAPCPIAVYKGDVLSFNMECLFSEEKRREWPEPSPNIHIIGNLPFSVSTRLIILWLQDISERKNAWKFGRVPLTLTFQLEVAQRMEAPIFSPQRCRLSIMCQNWCNVEHKFTIPGKAFLPKPDVDVGVVHLVPLKTPVIDLPFKLVEKVVRSIFTYRQKFCYKGAAVLFPKGSQERLITEMFEKAEVNPEARPYHLTLPEIGRICYVYKDIITREPSLAKYNYRQKKLIEEDEYLDEDMEESKIDDPESVENEDKLEYR